MVWPGPKRTVFPSVKTSVAKHTSNVHSTLFPGYKHAVIVPELRNGMGFSEDDTKKEYYRYFPKKKQDQSYATILKNVYLNPFKTLRTAIRLETEHHSNGAQMIAVSIVAQQSIILSHHSKALYH